MSSSCRNKWRMVAGERILLWVANLHNYTELGIILNWALVNSDSLCHLDAALLWNTLSFTINFNIQCCHIAN